MNDKQLWGQIVSERWTAGVTEDACALAGSYRAFALQKQSSTKLGFDGGWHGPCEFELQASLQRVASVIAGSPSHVVFLLDGSGSVGGKAGRETGGNRQHGVMQLRMPMGLVS